MNQREDPFSDKKFRNVLPHQTKLLSNNKKLNIDPNKSRIKVIKKEENNETGKRGDLSYYTVDIKKIDRVIKNDNKRGKIS